jgi:hypothetical protein
MENHFRGKLFDPSKSLDDSKTSSCTYYLHYITFVGDWQRGSPLVVFSQTGFGARSITVCDLWRADARKRPGHGEPRDFLTRKDSSNSSNIHPGLQRLTFLFDNGKLICLVENKISHCLVQLKLKYPQPTLEPNGMENHFRGKLFDPSKSLDNSKTSSCAYYLHFITFVRDWQRGSRLVFSQTGFGARSVVFVQVGFPLH